MGSIGQDNPSGVVYSETHGPASTLKISWQGGSSYKNLTISVDLTLTLECSTSKLPVQLSELPQPVDDCLQRSGFHLVPVGFNIWRISFSATEKELMTSSPDGFKACCRVLKITRDAISECLGLDASLVPSYIFKTFLLSRLFTAGHCWEKTVWSEEIDRGLKVILQGMMREEIRSFFIPGCNLLSIGDHENKFRQYILEEMLNKVRGLKIKHTLEDVEEAKGQVGVLQMIDVLEYLFSTSFGGNDQTQAVWHKMFLNIANNHNPVKFGHFWVQFTDLDSTELDETVFRRLMQLWHLSEPLFKQLLASLQGELNLLAHKFYIRTCEKKKENELKHTRVTRCTIQQISLCQFLYEELEDEMEGCVNEENYSFWSNLHKGIPPGYRSSAVFQDVVDVTVCEGRDKGLEMLKLRIKQYLAMIPESCLMTLTINYARQFFYYSEDILRRKLDYITIPELDLD